MPGTKRDDGVAIKWLRTVFFIAPVMIGGGLALQLAVDPLLLSLGILGHVSIALLAVGSLLLLEFVGEWLFTPNRSCADIFPCFVKESATSVQPPVVATPSSEPECRVATSEQHRVKPTK